MGSEEVISAMQAATARLMIDTSTQPHTMDTGPPLLYPTPKDAAQAEDTICSAPTLCTMCLSPGNLSRCKSSSVDVWRLTC